MAMERGLIGAHLPLLTAQPALITCRSRQIQGGFEINEGQVVAVFPIYNPCNEEDLKKNAMQVSANMK